MTFAFNNFVEVLFDREMRKSADIAYHFHAEVASTNDRIVMKDLCAKVRSFAVGLASRNLVGQRIVLALPHGPEFILALYGCMAAGVIAVPVPRFRAGKEDLRFNSIIADCDPALILVDSVALGQVHSRPATDVKWPPLLQVADLMSDDSTFQMPELTSDSIAMLQYTSGSTGNPKGVMISHGNFLANCQLIKDTLKVTPESRGVLWLPFFHDMGLVGAVLMPMYCNACVDLMSPQDFLRSPMGWLKKLSDIGATMTAAPNFALERCCDVATPEIIASLNLSTLRCLLTGSEPVNPITLERFTKTFAPSGFLHDAFLPAYGLAEATLLATGTLKPGKGPTLLSLNAKALSENKVVQDQGNLNVARLVGNGHPNGMVQIADPETFTPLADGNIGEIWLQGQSIAKGYWGKPDLSKSAFAAELNAAEKTGHFYRTGDLGFILDDDLFITGRLKDLIIVRGRNIYPQDLEEVATRNQPLLLTGAAVAFPVQNQSTEDVVLVVEASIDQGRTLRNTDTARALVTDLLQRVAESHEVVPAEICILRPGKLPRTSSGKVRRDSARQEWVSSRFEASQMHRWIRPESVSENLAPLRTKGASVTRPELENWLIERLARHTGTAKHQIALDEPFSSYGLDSMTAVEMIDDINKLNIDGRTVDPVELFDYPTIASLLDHIFGEQPDANETQDGKSDLDREAEALAALLDE